MDRYSDMYDMDEPILKRRRMSVAHRAKQFAPFAALKEHGEAIEETADAADSKVQEEEHSGFLYEDMLVYKED